ncbi:MAG: hypothetical protein JRE45_05295 [Deltaproteobacteria bacterium]|nr:hypothetical protein [Deltaproteobacteria bacterium]
MNVRLICGVLLLSTAGALGCGEGSESGGSGGSGGTGGTIMIEPGPTCLAFCAKVVGDCEAFEFDEPACRQSCEESLAAERAKSEACGDAVEAVFQCATDLDCQGVFDWRDRVPLDDYPCRPTVQDVDLACPRT